MGRDSGSNEGAASLQERSKSIVSTGLLSPRADYGVSIETLKEQLLELGSERFFGAASLNIVRYIIGSYKDERTDYILHATAAEAFLQKYMEELQKKSSNLDFFPLEICKTALSIRQRFALDNDAVNKAKTHELAESALNVIEAYINGEICLSAEHLDTLKSLINCSINQRAQETNEEAASEAVSFVKRAAEVLLWVDKKTGDVALSRDVRSDFVRVSKYWLPQRLRYKTFEDFAVSDHPYLIRYLTPDVYSHQHNSKKDHDLMTQTTCIRVARIEALNIDVCRNYFRILSNYAERYNFYDFLFDKESPLTSELCGQFVEKVLLYAAEYPDLQKEKITKLCVKLYHEILQDDELKFPGFIQDTLINGGEKQRVLISTTLRCCDKLTVQEMRLRDSIDQNQKFDPVILTVEKELVAAGYSPHCYEHTVFDALLTCERFVQSSPLGRKMLERAALFRLYQARYGCDLYSREYINN